MNNCRHSAGTALAIGHPEHVQTHKLKEGNCGTRVKSGWDHRTDRIHMATRRPGPRSRRPPRSPSLSSDDRSMDTSSGPRSSGTPTRPPLVLGPEDRDKLTSDLVFFILAQEGRRVPIRKTAAYQAIHLNGQSRTLQEEVWRGAQAQLLTTLGLALAEHPDKKGVFFVLNRVGETPGQTSGHLAFSERETAHLGLLHTVLSLIYMSNEVVRDDVLFQFLKKLGVSPVDDLNQTTAGRRGPRAGRGPDPETDEVVGLFGCVRDLIFKEWGAKQHYLEITKLEDSPDPDHPVHEIRWGPRAHLEIKKSAMLTLVANLYGCQITSFKSQYSKIVKEEGEDAFAPSQLG